MNRIIIVFLKSSLTLLCTESPYPNLNPLNLIHASNFINQLSAIVM